MNPKISLTPASLIRERTQLTFVDPFAFGPETRAAFEYMLSREEDTVRNRFRHQWRSVIFKRSQVTDWRYALGEVGGNEAAARSR